MSKSNLTQRSRLFNGLVDRARKGLPSMSFKAMEFGYDFDDEDQVRDALQQLMDSGHVTGTLDGRFPTLHLWRSKFSAAEPLKRPMSLMPEGAEGEAKHLRAPERAHVPESPKVDPLPVPVSALHVPEPLPPVPAVDSSVVPIMLPVDPNRLTITLSDATLDWVSENLSLTNIDLADYVAWIVEAHALRCERQRLRIPAPLLTAAIAAGEPAESFIVKLALERLIQTGAVQDLAA